MIICFLPYIAQHQKGNARQKKVVYLIKLFFSLEDDIRCVEVE